MNMGKKTILLTLLALALILGACASGRAAEGTARDGTRFAMAMETPDRTVEFKGAALGEDFSLTGVVGGIETIISLTGGKLYTLTPAIKTASEIDIPEAPDVDAAGWPEWLTEPGRVNPLTFATLIGLTDDFNGKKAIGENETVGLEFTSGVLDCASFPNPEGEGTISYTYSDFESDPTIKSEDFAVPPDYLYIVAD